MRAKHEGLTINLWLLRREYNLTQKQLATMLSLKQTTYSGYERGWHEPNIETLIKIADFYGITLDRLVGRAEYADDK